MKEIVTVPAVTSIFTAVDTHAGKKLSVQELVQEGTTLDEHTVKVEARDAILIAYCIIVLTHSVGVTNGGLLIAVVEIKLP